jgi:hypothetical protein
MVLESDKCIATGTQKPKAKVSTTKRVQDIANTIIKYFWADIQMATKVFCKIEIDGSNGQMHLGELISRDWLLTCLETFTIFQLYHYIPNQCFTIHIYPKYPYLYIVLSLQH